MLSDFFAKKNSWLLQLKDFGGGLSQMRPVFMTCISHLIALLSAEVYDDLFSEIPPVFPLHE